MSKRGNHGGKAEHRERKYDLESELHHKSKPHVKKVEDRKTRSDKGVQRGPQCMCPFACAKHGGIG